jgi:uncharacterized protein (TIGR03067 family)
MRLWLTTVLAVGLLAGTARADEAKAAKKAEQAAWKVTRMVVDGAEVPADNLKKITLIVSGNNYVVKEGGKTVTTGTVKLDQSKNPITIDRTVTAGEDKGKTFLGIVEMTADTMKVCWAPAGKERPTEFASKKGSGHILQVFEKQKK